MRSKSLTNSFLGVSLTPRAWFLKMTSSSHRLLTPNELDPASERETVDNVEGEAPNAAWRFNSGLIPRRRVSLNFGMRKREKTDFPSAISSSREVCSDAARSRSCDPPSSVTCVSLRREGGLYLSFPLFGALSFDLFEFPQEFGRFILVVVVIVIVVLVLVIVVAVVLVCGTFVGDSLG